MQCQLEDSRDQREQKNRELEPKTNETETNISKYYNIYEL